MGASGPLRWNLPILAIALTLALAPAAQAKPHVCKKDVIADILVASGEDGGAGIHTVLCGDVTHDGVKDAVFTVLSGGTAGPTHFGVVRGKSDTAGDTSLILYEDGYKVTVDRVNSRRFDVQQPYYAKDDPNCCPSAFDVFPYRFNGERFKQGKSKRYKKFQKRFR